MRLKALCVVLALGGVVSPVFAGDLLEANFDDKTIDVPIGTGGPEAGEPVIVEPGVVAIVRDTPFATPCLEISDGSSTIASSVRFEFLEGVEVTSGIVTINAELWFDVTDLYFVYVREPGGSAQSFLIMSFNHGGGVSVVDHDSNPGEVGSYVAGRAYPLSLVYDMDAGTYDIYFDCVRVLTDEPHGVVSRGVGAVLFGTHFDPDLAGRFFVDNITVMTGEHPFACCAPDFDGDEQVATSDLLVMLGAWGPCEGPCEADLNGDGAVETADLLQLLGAWGDCP